MAETFPKREETINPLIQETQKNLKHKKMWQKRHKAHENQIAQTQLEKDSLKQNCKRLTNTENKLMGTKEVWRKGRDKLGVVINKLV